MSTERLQAQAPELALGDWIECDVTHPSPRTMAACLSTPQALAEGRKMLRRVDSGWRRATRDWSAGRADGGAANE